MQVTFNFDKDTRSITLVVEDELERAVLKEMHDRVSKGQTVQIGRVETPEGLTEFRFEVKVNGHQGKVQRQYNEPLTSEQLQRLDVNFKDPKTIGLQGKDFIIE